MSLVHELMSNHHFYSSVNLVMVKSITVKTVTYFLWLACVTWHLRKPRKSN